MSYQLVPSSMVDFFVTIGIFILKHFGLFGAGKQTCLPFGVRIPFVLHHFKWQFGVTTDSFAVPVCFHAANLYRAARDVEHFSRQAFGSQLHFFFKLLTVASL